MKEVEKEIKVAYEPNKRQCVFHASNADECVYGGAKGGGKSCALVMEALIYGFENEGANVYLFRETYDDLEANLISEFRKHTPGDLYRYNESKHVATLINGSRIMFRYISSFADAESYQGREMDWVGVDELTKHEERSIQVLLSCLRSAQGFKPRFRATCNPGGKGHVWVKRRYITATEYGAKKYVEEETENLVEFVPAKVTDNPVLMKNDPRYVKRLRNLPEKKRKAFLDGDWDIFEGQYFEEFKREIHVIEPFLIPDHWRRYTTMDYGRDMLAHYFIAMDPGGKAYVYKETYESGLLISEAAERINAKKTEEIYQNFAPPDLWNKERDTGKSTAEIFAENGIHLTRAKNSRVAGWYALREWLRPIEDEHGRKTANLVIFKNCKSLIDSLQQIQIDDRDPNDCATEPHDVTHAPDAIRYFASERTAPAAEEKDAPVYNFSVEVPPANPAGYGEPVKII